MLQYTFFCKNSRDSDFTPTQNKKKFLNFRRCHKREQFYHSQLQWLTNQEKISGPHSKEKTLIPSKYFVRDIIPIRESYKLFVLWIGLHRFTGEMKMSAQGKEKKIKKEKAKKAKKETESIRSLTFHDMDEKWKSNSCSKAESPFSKTIHTEKPPHQTMMYCSGTSRAGVSAGGISPGLHLCFGSDRTCSWAALQYLCKVRGWQC